MRNQPIYEAVVNSGGIAGFTSALRISQEGGRVAIVEPRGALLWEVCKARQRMGDLADFMSEPLASNIVLSQIGNQDTVRNGVIEPVLMELTADRMAKEAGIDIYYQSRVIASSEDRSDLQILLAQKGRMHTIAARSLVQYTEKKPDHTGKQRNKTIPELDIYTLIFANCSIDMEINTTLNLNSGEIAVRVRRTAWENECCVDIAYPIIDSGICSSELEIAMVYEQIVLSLKEQIPALVEATPIYLSDEPWRWRKSAPEASISSFKGINRRIIGTERVEDTFSWDRCMNELQQLFVYGEKIGYEAMKKGTISP